MCTSIQGCSSRGISRYFCYKEMGGNVVIGRSIYGVVVVVILLYTGLL